MGQSASVNAAFGIATMTIGVPTGVKIYDWIWTMFRGEVRFHPAHGPVAGLHGDVRGWAASPASSWPPRRLDYMMHNTLFLVAHFHNMLIPGTLYGLLAGYMFWFPKAFGFRLNERWGWVSAGCWISGFYLAFFPLYVLGAAGMARRTQAVFDPAFRPWLLLALFGAFLLLTALTTLFVQLYVSIRDRHANMVPVGDPWDARGLEWSVAAPPAGVELRHHPPRRRPRRVLLAQAGPAAPITRPTITGTSSCPGTPPAVSSSASPPACAASVWSGISGGWRCCSPDSASPPSSPAPSCGT